MFYWPFQLAGTPNPSPNSLNQLQPIQHKLKDTTWLVKQPPPSAIFSPPERAGLMIKAYEKTCWFFWKKKGAGYEKNIISQWGVGCPCLGGWVNQSFNILPRFTTAGDFQSFPVTAAESINARNIRRRHSKRLRGKVMKRHQSKP